MQQVISQTQTSPIPHSLPSSASMGQGTSHPDPTLDAPLISLKQSKAQPKVSQQTKGTKRSSGVTLTNIGEGGKGEESRQGRHKVKKVKGDAKRGKTQPDHSMSSQQDMEINKDQNTLLDVPSQQGTSIENSPQPGTHLSEETHTEAPENLKIPSSSQERVELGDAHVSMHTTGVDESPSHTSEIQSHSNSDSPIPSFSFQTLSSNVME